MTKANKPTNVAPINVASTNPTPFVNTLVLSDEELKVLSDLVRQSKVTASSEELLMLKLGKSQSVLLDVVYKIAVQWEQRMAVLQAEQAAANPPVEAQ